MHDDWHEAADWDRAGAHDRVFRLDPGARRDPERRRTAWRDSAGRFHELGAAYRRGGGRRGNRRRAAPSLTCRRRWTTSHARRPCRGLARAARGAAAVRRDRRLRTRAASSTRRRAPSTQRQRASTRPSRSTTSSALALATPGVPVARARAVANHGPAPSVLPGAGRRSRWLRFPVPAAGAAPEPRAARCRRALPRAAPAGDERDSHRAPRYRRVSVQATLHLACDGDAQRVIEQARAHAHRRLFRSAHRRHRRQRLAFRAHRLPQRGPGAARRHRRRRARHGARFHGRPGAIRDAAAATTSSCARRTGRARPPSLCASTATSPVDLNRSEPHECESPDEALARLNYFNGQRLAAADFRSEQSHHLGDAARAEPLAVFGRHRDRPGGRAGQAPTSIA